MSARELDFAWPRPDFRPFIEDGRAEAVAWVGDSCETDCSCGSGAQGEPWAVLEEPDPTDLTRLVALTPGADWQLLRKFAMFWPRKAPAPPAFPWLGNLVSRRKVSQFPNHFARIEATDTVAIEHFIARTLMDVEPSRSDGEGDKKCCKKKPSPRYPPDILDETPSPEDCGWRTCADSECGGAYQDQAGDLGLESPGFESGTAGRFCAEWCCRTDVTGLDCDGNCRWVYTV